MRKSVTGLLIVLAALFLTAQACSNFYLYQGPENDLALMCTADGDYICDDQMYDALRCESGALPGSWELVATGTDCVINSDGDLVPVLPPLDGDTDGDGILDANDDCPTEDETVNGFDDADGCADVAPTPGGCIVGTVVDALGDPRVGVNVIVHGETSYTSTTDASGDFCLEVHDGLADQQLEVQYQIGGGDATQLTDYFSVDAGTTSCSGDTSACLNFGVIPADVMTTVSGVVVNEANQPLEGENVVSSTGAQGVTNSNGAFCLLVPVFRDVNVYVTGADLIFTPVLTFTQPDADLCSNGSPNLVVLRPYTETACVTGQVVDDLDQPVNNIPVEAYIQEFEDVPVMSGVTDSSGVYCFEVPVQEGISVAAASSLEVVDTTHSSGAVCDEGSPFGECLVVPNLILSS